MMRYLIADEENGMFLGTHHSISFTEDKKIYVIFAKNDIFGLYKAASFDTEEEAKEYIDGFLDLRFDGLKILPIESKDKYVDVSDIIKAGYGKYTFDMIDGIPMTSEEIH